MLRRSAKVLRTVLLLVGLGLLLAIPLSFQYGLWVYSPHAGFYSLHGTAIFWWGEGPPDWGAHVKDSELDPYRVNSHPLLPVYNPSFGGGPAVYIPLWLLAAICLAWPVTSFLITRRRRKGRGFAVEPTAAGSTPLPPGEVAAQRSGADGEGGQQHVDE